MKSEGFLLTKIIATLGPVSSDTETISSLIREGVRVFRINFSHGTFQEYESLLANIRKAEADSGTYIAVIGDLSGPKIRVGKVIDPGVRVQQGDIIKFVKEKIIGGGKAYEMTFSTTLPGFIDEVAQNERILIDDGNIELKCLGRKKDKQQEWLECQVIVGGLITSSKGINLPETNLTVDALTEKDIECVDFAVKNHFDYLALSFVRKAEDIRLLKKILLKKDARPSVFYTSARDIGFKDKSDDNHHFIPIITKIEKPQAINNLEAIIRETDAVMVARGDLGVEMDLAEVTILQKKVVKYCQMYGRPVIVATQMLQSMIDVPVPTRAEVSDVANAIFDGADAVMLSGETAIGKYPVETVRMMNKIADRTNNYIKTNAIHPGSALEKPDLSFRAAAIAKGVQTIVDTIDPKFLIVWTNMGGSAVYLSQYRMPVPILAFNSFDSRLRQLSLMYGIRPINMAQPKSGSDFIRKIDRLLLKEQWAKKGDAVIIVSGDPIDRKGFANRIVIHYIGETVD
jgi:pyruvate kinase